MDNDKDNSYYLSKIIEDLTFINNHMEFTSYDDFCGDEMLMDSMMFRIVQISENCKRLTEGLEKHTGEYPGVIFQE